MGKQATGNELRQRAKELEALMAGLQQEKRAIERDITARKRTEAVLRNYERIISTSREHMSLLDRHYVYQAVNDAYLTAHNHRREEIVGHSVAEMLGRETFEKLVKDKLDRCLAGEEVRYQGWFQFAGLGRLFMDVAYYPLVEADGSVSGVVVNARNLTDQHEAEEALRQAKEGFEIRVAERTAELLEVNARLEQEVVEHRRSEARLHLLSSAVEQTGEGIGIADLKGTILFMNRAFAAMHGYEAAELVGRPIAMLHTAEQLPCVESTLLQTMQTGEFSGEVMHARRDGSVFPGLMHVSLLRDEGGTPIAIIGTVRDITDRKEIEEELRQARRAAEAASLAKSAFLANMSHEVRTPLNAIIGFADILKDGVAGQVTSDQQEYLGEIMDSGHRLLGLINDILDLSLFEVERTEIAREDVALGLLLGEGLDSFRDKARQRNIFLRLEIDPGIGTIASDERILRKVVARLLENALKFTPPGGSVGIEVGKENGELRITVWDTGIGISEEQLAGLFKPFQQGDSSLSKGYQGVGLGLVLCKRFLELLGGRIQVESEVQAGSRFICYLPDLVGGK